MIYDDNFMYDYNKFIIILTNSYIYILFILFYVMIFKISIQIYLINNNNYYYYLIKYI